MELNLSKEQELSCQVSSNSLLLNYIIVFFFQRVEIHTDPLKVSEAGDFPTLETVIYTCSCQVSITIHN